MKKEKKFSFGFSFVILVLCAKESVQLPMDICGA
jgi:hypothetical protein